MRIFLFLMALSAPLYGAEEAYKLVLFTPPAGWQALDPAAFPPSVKYMVIGKGKEQFPPSLNLGTDRHLGTLADYLRIVRDINAAQGTEWKDLGQIKTEAGMASLSQIDARTEWGEVRMMHVIYHDADTVYILTAAALKEEFPKFYPDFFRSMQSLRFCFDPLEIVPDKEKPLAELLKLKEALKKHPIGSEEFENAYWKPFADSLARDYRELGADWQKAMLAKVREELQ